MPAAQDDENEHVLKVFPALDVSKLFNMAGRVCVVTGGGSGIGAMISAGFVANGATVIITSRKDSSAYAAELTKRGPGKCICLRADLMKAEQVESLVASIGELTDRIHVLVNNSGTNWAAPIDEYPAAAFDKVMALNVRAVFDMTRACLPLLEAGSLPNQPCSVINISSIDSITFPVLETYAYSASKAAVTHMTKVVAGKLGRRGAGGITCNAVLPGPFQSRMMRATLDTMGEGIARGTSLGRIGAPQDMAAVALYLASKAGAYVTGAAIVVDGGTVVKSSL